MTRQRILLTGLWVAIAATTICSGDADARNRCCNRCANGGWRQNNGYAYNSGSNYYYSNQTGNGAVNGNVSNQQWNAATGQWNTTPANQPVVQPNGTYSASKPVISNVAPPSAPAPFNNHVSNANSNNAAQRNTSPDADNGGRGASDIQGTTPSKAPLPAATRNP